MVDADASVNLYFKEKKVDYFKNKKFARAIPESQLATALEPAFAETLKILDLPKLKNEVTDTARIEAVDVLLRSLSDENREKRHQANNLVDAVFLAKGARLAKAVGRILVNGSAGTGSLISEDLVLTNHHVIGSSEEAKNAVIQFQYEFDENGSPLPVKTYRVSELITANRALDYSIVRVENNPGETFGYVNIDPHTNPVIGSEENGYPVIVQHPQGGPKKVALTDNHLVNISAPFFHYTTDTMGGSSGSLVFNQKWIPMGLHHAGRRTGYDDMGRPTAENEGILMSAIVADLKSKNIIGTRSESISIVRKLLNSTQIDLTKTNMRSIMAVRDSGLLSQLHAEAPDQEIVPVLVAAAGVASGAAVAHLANTSSKEKTGGSQESWKFKLDLSISNEIKQISPMKHLPLLTFEVPNTASAGEVYSAVYPIISDPSYYMVLHTIGKESAVEEKQIAEAFPLAAVYLAGVAAGAKAYAANK